MSSWVAAAAAETMTAIAIAEMTFILTVVGLWGFGGCCRSE